MRIAPTGAELLTAAQSLLRERLLPRAPEDARHVLCAINRTMAEAAQALGISRQARPEDLARLDDSRVVLREDLLSRLPAERRYDARLVAKAIAIATAELAHGDAFERSELTALADLVGEAAPAANASGPAREMLSRLSARLCAEIRAGRVDPGSVHYAATYRHLCETTRHALSESHPAYLQAAATAQVGPSAG